MDGQHPRYRPGKGATAQLRRLPHRRTHHAFEIRYRRIPDADLAAHAELCATEPADPSATPAGPAADGGTGRGSDRDLSRRGEVSQHDQSQRHRAVEISAEDAAASERRGNKSDLHRV